MSSALDVLTKLPRPARPLLTQLLERIAKSPNPQGLLSALLQAEVDVKVAAFDEGQRQISSRLGAPRKRSE